MDRDELGRQLKAASVRADAYDFVGDETANETLVLRSEGDDWVVYYAERGLQTAKRIFASEAQACEYFLELICSDPTARAP